MSSELFDDPRKKIKAWAAQMVISESDIRRALQHSNHPSRSARFLKVTVNRFKKWANKYIDVETGLTLLELQRRSLLIEKANKVGRGPKGTKVNNLPNNKLEITKQQVLDAMAISNSNREAAEVLDISRQAWKKYASMYTDDETGMTLYEIQHEKWRKINYERFMARKESGWFEKLEARKKAFAEARFKPGHVILEEHKYKGLQLSEELIRSAIRNTRSNKEAAEWLRVSYKTWRKYASMYKDPVNGRTLFDIHTAVGGKGVPKVRKSGKYQVNPRALELGYQLVKGQYSTPARIDELSARLMKDGRLGFCCAECGFSQKRPIDMKMPLLLNFKNNDRTDWTEDNLRWLCYNCSFLLSLDYFTRAKRQVLQAIPPEAPDAPKELESFYKIDEFYLEHLKHLGIKDMADNVKAEEDRLKETDKTQTKDMTHPDLEDLIDYR
jgi:hypothetical protein